LSGGKYHPVQRNVERREVPFISTKFSGEGSIEARKEGRNILGNERIL
jgi:hypothetical protein